MARIAVTTMSGFEDIVVAEVQKRLLLDPSANVATSQSRVFFSLSDADDLPAVRDLKSCNHAYLVVAELRNRVGTDQLMFLEELATTFPQEIEWKGPLSIYQRHRRAFIPRALRRKDIAGEDAHPTPAPDGTTLRHLVGSFRVTCSRASHGSNKRHSFTSVQAAAKLGGGLNANFGWPVDLTSPRAIDINLFISDNDVWIGLRLTPESLHRRNLAVQGPTSLLNSIAYCMVHLAAPQPGEIVVDPMCGGGTVSIEAAISWPHCAHLCGDSHAKAIQRAKVNVNHLRGSSKSDVRRAAQLIDIVQWDATRIALRTSSIDVFVTDLPFGKRIGSLTENMRLYPLALYELGRVARVGTARGVFLTAKANLFRSALAKVPMWTMARPSICINQGGTRSHVFILTRTSLPFEDTTPPAVPQPSKHAHAVADEEEEEADVKLSDHEEVEQE